MHTALRLASGLKRQFRFFEYFWSPRYSSRFSLPTESRVIGRRSLYQPAHVKIIVDQAGSPSLAGLVPQNARVVYQRPEDHRRRYCSQDSDLYPLDSQSERSLVVPNDSQGRRQGRHRAQKRHQHVAERQNDEKPQITTAARARCVYRLVRHNLAGRDARHVQTSSVDAITLRVDLQFTWIIVRDEKSRKSKNNKISI